MSFPNAIDAQADFFDVINGHYTVTISLQNITIGTAKFDSKGSYFIEANSPYALTFQVSSGSAMIDITSAIGTGAARMTCPVVLASDLHISLDSVADFTLLGQVSGTGGITTVGKSTGSIILQNANSYGGATTINQGSLTYAAAGSIPSASVVTVGGGVSSARLIIDADMTSSNALTATVNANASIAPNNNRTAWFSSLSGSGSLILSAGYNATNLLSISGSTSTTLSGVISGGATSNSSDPTAGNRLMKGGTSTLTLSGANTYVSRTFIAEGIIDTQHSSALGIPGGRSGVFVQATGTQGSLYIDGSGLSVDKVINLNGPGYANGALRNMTGNNAITGNIQIGWSGGTESPADVTIRVDSGTQLTASGIVSGANNLDITGGGTLIYRGAAANTLSGTTTLSAGTLQLDKTGAPSLVGNAIVNAGTLLVSTTDQISNTVNITLGASTQLIFEQSGSDAFGATVSGSGNVIKQGSGTLTFTGTPTVNPPTSIHAGTFLVDGTYQGSGTLSIASGATLGGSGTIAQKTTVHGTLSPGNSIGTLTFTKDIVLASGSIFYNEISPTASDLVDVTGTFTIASDVTLNVDAAFAVYVNGTTYHIVHTSGGVFGTFSSVSVNYLLLDVNLKYTSTDVYLVLGIMPFEGNAEVVAQCLGPLSATSGSDFAYVKSALLFITTRSDLKEVLLQLQPSAFTALAMDQEYNTLYVGNSILERLDLFSCASRIAEGSGKHVWISPLDSFSRQDDRGEEPGIPAYSALPGLALGADGAVSDIAEGSGKHVWISPLGSFTRQGHRGEEPGFTAYSALPGLALGVDGALSDNLYLGGCLASTTSHLRWEESRGKADIQSAYVAIYGKWVESLGYVESALMGAVNFYHVHRHIPFFNRTARSSHYGGEGSFHLKAGMTRRYKKFIISPFGRLDYIYIYEGDFRESGAQSWGVKNLPKTADF